MSIYAIQSDVEPLVKFISDDASTELYTRVLLNADSWVNARLLSNSLHIWTSVSSLVETEETVNGETTTVTSTVTTIEPETPIPDLLKTAAVYYAASDIILALYNGEEMPTQYDTYFNKAETMLDAYIQQMKEELKNTELKSKNIVRHSKSQSYNQRMHRRPIL
jgi:hypothetical protein